MISSSLDVRKERSRQAPIEIMFWVALSILRPKKKNFRLEPVVSDLCEQRATMEIFS